MISDDAKALVDMVIELREKVTDRIEKIEKSNHHQWSFTWCEGRRQLRTAHAALENALTQFLEAEYRQDEFYP